MDEIHGHPHCAVCGSCLEHVPAGMIIPSTLPFIMITILVCSVHCLDVIQQTLAPVIGTDGLPVRHIS